MDIPYIGLLGHQGLAPERNRGQKGKTTSFVLCYYKQWNVQESHLEVVAEARWWSTHGVRLGWGAQGNMQNAHRRSEHGNQSHLCRLLLVALEDRLCPVCQKSKECQEFSNAHHARTRGAPQHHFSLAFWHVQNRHPWTIPHSQRPNQVPPRHHGLLH